MPVYNAKQHSTMAYAFYVDLVQSRLFIRAKEGRMYPRSAIQMTADELAHELAIETAEKLAKLFAEINRSNPNQTPLSIGRHRERAKTVAPSPKQQRGF